ncbi:Gram-negative bacterial tonB protein [compost metagenome]|uniref:energy transducer TonB n=1 Tax=Stenotrophomonas sp. PA-6-5C TaxID=2665487 RepID=UPI000F9456E4|nr:energy transducer TonB [Stenotrophomonas sp. PA-6-5C]
MKLLGVLAVLLLALIGMAPFWGDLGVLVYSSIGWLGRLLSSGALSDGRAALRAALLIGGAVSVLSFLRVAVQDRAVDYLIASVMFGFLSFVIFVVTGISGDGAAGAGSMQQGARSVMVGEDRMTVPRWYSRGHFEREMLNKVHETARAAARGDLQRTQTLMQELDLWARNGPALREDRTEYERLRAAYNETIETLAARSGRRTQRTGGLASDAGAMVDRLTAEEARELELKQIELLQQMWKVSPSSTTVAMRLLATDLQELAIRSRWSPRKPFDREGDAALEERLWRVHGTQEVLFAYAPLEERLWNAYASTMVDTDEELALGALVIAGLIDRGDKVASADPARFDVNTLLLGSDVFMLSTLLASASEDRMEILKARATLLLGDDDRQPKAGKGETPDTTGTAAGPAGPVVSEPSPPATSKADVARQAQRAMPPAGMLVDRKGLALRTSPLLPSPSPPAEYGQVLVDLPAAGFKDLRHGIPLRAPVQADSMVTLQVDVWQSGVVTAVLIESSSGSALLDEAARQGARTWHSASKVLTGGERRQVTVVFKAPVAAAPTPMTVDAPSPITMSPPPPQLNPEQALGAQLAAMARRQPPRYPRGDGETVPEGSVELLITLSAEGRVLDVSVDRSSGHPALDRAAREAALKWHVTPTRPVTTVKQITLRVPVQFQGG